jgi:hypothetical protein
MLVQPLRSDRCRANNASRQSWPPLPKNPHQGPVAPCRVASAAIHSQARIASGKNTRCGTISRQTPLLPQGKPKATTNPFKAVFCSFINNYAQGTAGFEIGDGFGLSVNFSFTNHGISLFVGGGLGVGVGWFASGGATVGQSTGAFAGLRGFVSGSIAPPTGGPAAFVDVSAGTDGFDASAGVGRGYGGGVVSGLGVNLNIVDLEQAQDLCSQ